MKARNPMGPVVLKIPKLVSGDAFGIPWPMLSEEYSVYDRLSRLIIGVQYQTRPTACRIYQRWIRVTIEGSSILDLLVPKP
ncbi:MAG: hypothetical protein BWY53_00691 [Parcubacteria group bacterium ADurb.Bin326]|nr:MAG: hypothetical protein BWY53_00691 [Parcubacteria group bacterium ADurb.Bin326]